MGAHRSLDRDSVSNDNDHHLAAIASFARSPSPAILSQDAGTEFLQAAETLVPILNAFLNGSRADEVVSELRIHLPKVRDSLRQMVGDLDHAHTRGLPRDSGIDSMEWLLVGIHIEAMVFALFPERWNAMNLGEGCWGDHEVLRNNVYWTHQGLQRADILCAAWRDALGRVYGNE